MRKHKDSDRDIVLSIFGLDDSGKTTTTKVLKGEKDLGDIVPTIGFQPEKFNYRSFNVTINDLGGGERVRDLWKHYMAESYGFLYVIDSSNRKRIEETKRELTQFLQNPKVAGKPILILGNKQDKAHALDESEIVQALDIEELVNSTKTPCRVETCCVVKSIEKAIDPALKTGFDWLVKFIELNYEDLKTRIDKDFSEQRSRENRVMEEKRRKIEEKRKFEKRDDDDDATDYTQIKRDPFRPIGEKFKDDNKQKGFSYTDNKLLSHEKPNELRSSPRPRLNTIEEERAKLNKFRNNKLAPLNDESEFDLYKSSKNTPSWAITSSGGKKSNQAPF